MMRHSDQLSLRPASVRRRKFGLSLIVFLSLLQLVLAFNPIPTTAADEPTSISGVDYQTEIITDGKPNFNRVMPPANFSRSNPRPTSATISVTYYGFGSVPEAQTAFQYAVDIWASQLNSSVPINVVAYWDSLGSYTLGRSGPYVFYRDFPNAPRAGTFYPKALANNLAGYNLNYNTPEIETELNQNFPYWYFGTDGNVPADKIDFVSVVLQGLGNGLGFTGSMTVDSSGNGKWGLGGNYPIIYDRFAYNGSNQALLNTSLFPNNSSRLAAQLTSNNIFFNGPNTKAANGNAPARFYAPRPWQSGSSYSHLDETTYNNTPNALMTPFIGTGEVEHNPGPLILGIFRDMGWNINPNPPPIAPTNLTATAVSTGSINLHWANPPGPVTAIKIERESFSASFTQIAQIGGTATSYTDTGLTSNTFYSYRIRATNSGGDSVYSNWSSAITFPAPPSAPTNLVATPVSTSNINLTWTNPTGTLTSIRIERSTDATGSFFYEVAQLTGTATSYNDNYLSTDTTYYYRIRATNNDGYSPYSNVTSATTLPYPPFAPYNLTATTRSSIQIDLSWANPSGPLDGIKIERGTDSTGPFLEIAAVNPNFTTYSDIGLDPSTTYYYRIRATNRGGDSNYSQMTNATTVTPPSPLIVTVPTDGGDEVDQDTPDTLSYALKRVTTDQSIIFQLSDGGNTVTVSGPLRPVPNGAAIYGGVCGTTGINVIGSGVTEVGLTLNKNLLTNIKVSGFGNNQIVTSSPGSILRCSISSNS